MSSQRIHALVAGRVQGVAFRWSTVETAERLGLAGWVRNLPDGRVELEAEGAPDAVAELLAWASEGPPAARVESVESREVPVTGEPGFTLRR